MEFDERVFDLLVEADFDAAFAYRIVLGELIVELVRSGVLRRTQALKILLRAQAVAEVAAKDRPHRGVRDLLTEANDKLREDVVRRLGAGPDVRLLRKRARRVRVAQERRLASR